MSSQVSVAQLQTPWSATLSDIYSRDASELRGMLTAARDRIDFARFEVGLAYTKADGPLSLTPRVDCGAEPETCERLKRTDFTTEVSLRRSRNAGNGHSESCPLRQPLFHGTRG